MDAVAGQSTVSGFSMYFAKVSHGALDKIYEMISCDRLTYIRLRNCGLSSVVIDKMIDLVSESFSTC